MTSSSAEDRTGRGHDAARLEDDPVQVGQKIGRYVVVERLGAGGMGVVYAAEDPQLDRRVALKLLLSERGEKAAARRARLLREAQAMARLKHANVVGVLDVGIYDERVFLTMEYLEGARTLEEWIEEDEPPWQEILAKFQQAGEGLAAAHRAGLVHRDFKPENVLISHDGQVRVTDFGLARPVGRDAPSEVGVIDAAHESDPESAGRLTKTGAAIGTPAYMAPEQHKRERVDARSDQFSFCVALFESLYGLAPFEGGDRNELADAVTRGRMRQPPWDTKVPPYVWRVVRRGLIADPRERFDSLERLLAELRMDPARTYRRVAVGTAVGLAVLGGSIAVAAQLMPTEQVCGDGRAQLRGVWDDARRVRLARTFKAIETGYAVEAWGRVERSLDEYADAWVDAHHRACLAAQDGAQPVESVAARTACLELRKRALAAVVEVVGAADAPSLTHAIGAVKRLPSLSPCYGVAALQGPSLSDPAQLAELADAQGRVEKARALAGMGRSVEAHTEVDLALQVAERLDHAPLLTIAAFERARLLTDAGDYAAAQLSMEQAYFAAHKASDPGLAVDAAAELAQLVGVHASDLEGGLEWIRHARAAMERLGHDVEREAAILLALAEIYHAGADYEHARGQAAQGAALLERSEDSDRALLASLLNTLGNALSGMALHAEALEQYARVREIREKLWGENHPHVGRALNNLGTTEQKLERLDDALVHLHRAALVLERSLGPDHPSVSIPLINLAQVYADRGEVEEALRYGDRAVALAEAAFGPDHITTAERRTVRALMKLTLLGKQASVIDELQACVRVYETEYGEHALVAKPLTGLARAQLLGEQFQVAVESATRAGALRRASMHEEDPLIAEVELLLARAEYAAGADRGAAVARAERAQQMFQRARPPRPVDLAEAEAWLRTHPAAPPDLIAPE